MKKICSDRIHFDISSLDTSLRQCPDYYAILNFEFDAISYWQDENYDIVGIVVLIDHSISTIELKWIFSCNNERSPCINDFVLSLSNSKFRSRFIHFLSFLLICYKILEFIFVVAINLHLFVYSIRMVAIYSLVTSLWITSFTSIFVCIFVFLQ